MLKLIGAIMIILSASAYGLLKSNSLKKRTENLKKLFASLNLLENEITYKNRDIKDAVRSIGQLQEFKLFTDAAENMNSHSVKNSFIQACTSADLHLLPSDKDVIFTFCENLGMTDSLTQVKNISYAKKTLSALICDAENNYQNQGKLFRSMGLLCGLFIAILLL